MAFWHYDFERENAPWPVNKQVEELNKKYCEGHPMQFVVGHYWDSADSGCHHVILVNKPINANNVPEINDDIACSEDWHDLYQKLEDCEHRHYPQSAVWFGLWKLNPRYNYMYKSDVEDHKANNAYLAKKKRT